MASGSNFEARVLMAKGKRAAAAYVHADCSTNPAPIHLNEVLDNLLNPAKAIDEWETIDWCKWLIAGGRTPDDFASTVRTFDNATTCGLVWTPNFVAYRCRTCGISPCMSLCTECFKKGNHQRHDFNMFLSQAGGACDCGDTSVMKETGFCDRHGPNKSTNTAHAPSDLMCVAQAMMPRIILRLVQHLRENSTGGTPDAYKWAINDAEAYITMLLDFNNMGGLMRRVMTTALTNPQMYRILNEVPDPPESDYAQYLVESKRMYEEALKSLPNPVPMDEYKDCPSLQLAHKTFLEELVFWTVKFEFPQKVVCLLLNMLPDTDYKEALTRAFVLHYSRISMMLERSADPDTLSNRVVHVSVQLFSNEGLALRMTEQLNLLHVMVVSLKYMMSKILIQNTLHDHEKNFHYVVDCGRPVMKEHCYWPLVSDLNNVLSHRPVALRFMSDDSLLEMWFTFLAMFQGMNVNQRELSQHVEFEPNTYYAAFSAELEASAYPMWALVSHLVDSNTSSLTRRVLTACFTALQDWLDAINYTSPNVSDSLQVSFHLPLHRYLAVFLCQAVAKQGIALHEVLPGTDSLHLLMMHPLRVQVAFYEILNGLWVRNGLQIKGQAMTYIQCNFCNSMVDADLYLLQICCTRIPAESFLGIVIDKFHVKDWMSLAPYHSPQNLTLLEGEHELPMLESFLTFLTTLISVRTNLGNSETALNRLEMITLLCMSDKTHSQLMELMPERCGTSQSRDFEALLAEVADYRAPALEATGNMQQGMYVPKAHVWQQQYDPIHVLLRAVHRRDFQTSMDRYTDYARHANKLKAGTSPWPPFRDPAPCGPAYEDPRVILRSRMFHALAFVVLYKATQNHVSEHVMALITFLLEQAIQISEKEKDEASSMCTSGSHHQRQLKDRDLANWYATDSIAENLCTVIGRISLTPEPELSSLNYSSDSDCEWDSSELAGGLNLEDSSINDILMLEGDDWGSPGPSTLTTSMMMMIPNEPEPQPNTAQRALPAPVPSDDSDNDTSLAVALPSTISTGSTSTTSSSGSSQPALPAPVQRPAVLAGNEIGRTSSSAPRSYANNVGSSLVPSRPGVHKITPYFNRKRQIADGSAAHPPTIKVNESIISLLLKLHSQLSGTPDSYNSDDAVARDSLDNMGDGTFYVARLLDRVSGLSQACREYIQETRNKLWPKQEEGEKEQKLRETREREERRRRAKERQQKLMQEFAHKQKQFMESAMETEQDTSNMDWSSENPETSEPLKQEYDCVICNQSSPSTEDKPMGLVVLLQATSVMGHRRRAPHPERSVLPTCDEEREALRTDDTMIADFDLRCEELVRYFEPVRGDTEETRKRKHTDHELSLQHSWLLSLNIGWEGGVHVQTCGHHLHLDCLKSYLCSLRTQQRQQSLLPDKGEYLCPLCRQLANSVLPLSPQLGDCSQIVRSRPSSMIDVLNELNGFLMENEQTPPTSNLSEAMSKAMEDMTSSTHLKQMFKSKTDKPSPQTLFLFVTSIARTNLEVELVQRGGNLVTLTGEPPNPLLPKRDCIVPLLHVLAIHARVLVQWPAWMTFQQLFSTESSSSNNAVCTLAEKEVPLMLRDPVALLLQFVLLLPLHLDQFYFTTMVKMVYNLLYYQVVAQISWGLSGTERAKACEGASQSHIDSLAAALALINQTLGQTELYMEDDEASCSNTQVNLVALEQQVQKLCLPFLRIASLLRHHIYNQPLPDIRASQSEFVRLVYYLELVTEGMDWGCFNAAVALNWPLDTDVHVHRTMPTTWCSQLTGFVGKSHIAARNFLMDQHITWQPPRLLQLPREYEKIFTYYHERACSQCHSVPGETSICLLCGTIVCLKQNCCKQQNICEAVAHSLECGAGTGVFLVVTSTYIIVIRGRRACLWGSLYLDDFEEEDRDLKRGKPLYLSKDRYQLLEQQWLAHRFDHTKKTWVWHRDAL